LCPAAGVDSVRTVTVYAIFNYDVEDPEAYGRYQSEAGAAGPVTLLALDPATTIVEGTAGGHQTVILSFDSEEAFNAWYRSPEYQKAIPTRQGATRPTLTVLVKGIS
jgi:uncharacterized protein (DUF1330 family)